MSGLTIRQIDQDSSRALVGGQNIFNRNFASNTYIWYCYTTTQSINRHSGVCDGPIHTFKAENYGRVTIEDSFIGPGKHRRQGVRKYGEIYRGLDR